jgi:diguanylate cyclase (GGDEF)-like protein/PAS domain S-box-containing protein
MFQTPIAYPLILFLSALLSIVVGVFVWQRRTVSGGLMLSLLLFAIAEWCFFAGLETMAVDIPTKVFWGKVAYIGIVSSSTFLLLFTIEYSQIINLFPSSRYPFLWIIPVISLILAFSNELHWLLWSGYSPIPGEPYRLIYHRGPFFWVMLTYMYAELAVSLAIIIRDLIVFHGQYRRQVKWILGASIFPITANVLYVSGFIPGLDLTPVGFALTGAFICWSLFRLQLIDLTPISHHALIENLADGMMVLDNQFRILDINPTARRILNINSNEAIGKPSSLILKDWPELVSLSNQPLTTQVENQMVVNTNKYYHVLISPMLDNRNHRFGNLVILHDISQQKNVEFALQKANERLQSQLAEIQHLQENLRQQAIRDSLTGLFNRRYLEETLERELSRAARKKYPLSLLMLDIDHFKKVNDTYGHAAGDEVLQSLGKHLLSYTRKLDIACRFGGEEFVLALAETNAASALKRAEEWRTAIEKMNVVHAATTIHITVSIGIAVYPQHAANMKDLLSAADQALYTAKKTGRNRVVLHTRQLQEEL